MPKKFTLADIPNMKPGQKEDLPKADFLKAKEMLKNDPKWQVLTYYSEGHHVEYLTQYEPDICIGYDYQKEGYLPPSPDLVPSEEIF